VSGANRARLVMMGFSRANPDRRVRPAPTRGQAVPLARRPGERCRRPRPVEVSPRRPRCSAVHESGQIRAQNTTTSRCLRARPLGRPRVAHEAFLLAGMNSNIGAVMVVRIMPETRMTRMAGRIRVRPTRSGPRRLLWTRHRALAGGGSGPLIDAVDTIDPHLPQSRNRCPKTGVDPREVDPQHPLPFGRSPCCKRETSRSRHCCRGSTSHRGQRWRHRSPPEAVGSPTSAA